MRLSEPVLFTATYAAGLVTGLLHFGAPFCIAAITLGTILVRRAPVAALLAAGGLLGGASAEIAWLRESGRCAARLPPQQFRVAVQLLEAVDSAGGPIFVQPMDTGCGSPVTAWWPSGKPMPAGVVSEVVSRWIPRVGVAGKPGGTLAVTEVGPATGRPSLPARLRTALSRANRALYGERAPMVDALILGRRGGIDRALQDKFAHSGLVHLLSISGFHVGIITAWIFLLGRCLRFRRGPALGSAAGASILYVAFLGWPAPATRAAALATLLALSRVRQRRVGSDALLSATCLCVMLVDPWSIVDLGAWLSVAALWGATTFSTWTDRVLGPTAWWRTLGSSIGATLATAPITAATLGTVAPVGVVLNFVAIPLAALAVPGVLASLLVYPIFGGLADSLAGGAGLALHLLELVAAAGAAVPGGHIIAPAGLESAWPWVLALSIGLWSIAKHNTLAEAIRRWGWALVVVLWVGLLWAYTPSLSNTGSGLALHFLDVGQGDGAVLRTPGGRWVVIDAGPRGEHGDAGRRVLVPFLARQGARNLAMIIVSHAHADHLGGVASVLERYQTEAVLEPGVLVADPMYYSFLDRLAAESIQWHPGRRGERIQIDGVSFTFLHPDPDWPGWGEDVNEDSLVLLVEYGAFQALFAGDAGFPAEVEMRSRAHAVDLLKVGHHGSRGSTSDEWLDSLRPRAAVISVGRNNYGHPSRETLGRLRKHRVEVWRTDLDGPVTVTTDGVRMTVRSRHREIVTGVR